MKQVHPLTNKEKKSFLSNDLIDRMIRVEQSIHYSFGRYVPYQNTDYFKSLSDSEKEGFHKFLSNRKKRRPFFLALLILPFLGLFFLSMRTGNVVKESIGESSFSITLIVLTLVVIAILVIVISSYFYRKTRDERLVRHNAVIDKWIVNKRTIRN